MIYLWDKGLQLPFVFVHCNGMLSVCVCVWVAAHRHFDSWLLHTKKTHPPLKPRQKHSGMGET